MPRKYTPEERIVAFWAKVDKTGGDDACWEWKATPRNKDGYGDFWWHGKHAQAHRVSYEIYYGAFPEEMFVLHRCDNTSCVNPQHLFLGTRQDNTDDMISKGRQRPPRWERHGMSKLSRKDVLEIRDRYSAGSIRQIDLSLEYEVTRQCIFRIVHHKSWRGLS